MFNCKRLRQCTSGSDEWNFGAAPHRVTSSRPAQRRSKHGGRRIYDENKDFKKVELLGGRRDFTQRQSGIIAGRGNQLYYKTPKSFYHDNLMLPASSECTKQHTPLKEITMNCRPDFKNDLQEFHKQRSGHFDYSPTSIKEQPSDLFLYTEDACYRNLKLSDVSPTKLSVFSKDSNSSELSANLSSTIDFLKSSGKNYFCLKELHSKSSDFLNFSSHVMEKSWGDIHQGPVQMIEDGPSVGPYPETPESSRGRISPPQSSYQMSFLNEEFGDLSDDALQISPMQGKLSPSQKFAFSDYTFSNFYSPSLPLEYENRSNFLQVQKRMYQHSKMPFRPPKLEPYLTDPDEEYAKMSANCEHVAILPRENFLFSR